MFSNDKQDNWVLLLLITEFVYNNSIYSVTEYTSFFITTDKNSKMSIDLLLYKEQTMQITELAEKLNNLYKDIKLQLL